MRNTTKPRTVSFEDALRNLASRLTGTPVASLPRTQEAIVQYMADHLPDPAAGVDMEELAEAVTKEVLARLGQTPPSGSEEPSVAPDGTAAPDDTGTAKNGSEAAQEADEGKTTTKRTRKTKTTD